MKDYKILKYIILCIAIIIVLCVIAIGIILRKKENINPSETINQEQETQVIARVQSRNDYFTVSNCVDKYITYLSTKQKDILYNYLDEEYKEKNNITEDNIYSHVKTFDDYYKFKAKEMYVRKLNDTISQYYVYGILTLEATEDDNEETPFYISIKLDKTNNTFSVIPDTYIDGLTVMD